MFKITKTPILILSTLRTGSTVLGAYIHSLSEKQVPLFQEPDFFGQESVDNFKNYFNESKEFILKCHFIYLHRYGSDVSEYLLREAYKIRIRRKDFIKQVASMYIASARNDKWFYRDQEQLPEPIQIDELRIKREINFLKFANNTLNNAPVKFDLDLYYEDLPVINNTGFFITPKPSNYDELLNTIKKLVQD